MQVTPKKNITIHYLPQEIRETRLTEVTYLPITREMLEMLFSNSAELIRRHLIDSSNAALLYFAIFLLHNHSL